MSIRNNTLKPGTILKTIPIGNGPQPTTSRTFADSLKGGLTRFGFRYGMGLELDANLRPIGPGRPPNFHAEQLYETIRMGFFPNLPSRFQAVFGCRTIEGARQFAREYSGAATPHPTVGIWRVEATDFVELDLRLVKGDVSYPSAHDSAMDYWSGRHSGKPLLEVLMSAPVRVIDLAETYPTNQPPAGKANA